jgi:hypothetical protein
MPFLGILNVATLAAPDPLRTLHAQLDAIPVAQDGHVIGSDYHNSLRRALVTLAGLLPQQVSSDRIAFAPAFVSNPGAASWTTQNGVAVFAVGGLDPAAATGWARPEADAALVATRSLIDNVNQMVVDIGKLPFPATVTNLASIAGTALGQASALDGAITVLSNALGTTEATARLQESLARADSLETSVANLHTAITFARSDSLLDVLARVLFETLTTHIETAERWLTAAKLHLHAVERILTTLASPPSSTCSGWFQVHLPQGTTIRSVTVIGARTGALRRFDVSLLQQRVSDSQLATLATVRLASAGNPNFTESVGLQAPVDHLNYKYLAIAEVDAQVGSRVEIRAIQITCLP